MNQTNLETVDRKIVDSLERISSAIDAFIHQRTDELGLNETQGRILMYLYQHPEQQGQTSKMAREMRRTKPTISDAVDSLVDKGFIERSLSEEDRRVMLLTLTETGEDAARTMVSWPEVLERYMDDFSSDQKRTVLTFLMNLMEGALEEGAIPVARMCTTCRFFNEDPEETDSPYYCDLLDIPLDEETLRIDCDEQEPEEALTDTS
jgi:DNA-binding MarR family transcriptional regulator